MVETINMAAVEAPDLIDERLDELYARKRSTLRVKPPSAGNYAFVFLASLVCLAAVYLPLLQYQFGFNDDYFALYERLRNTDWITTMTTQFMLQARPCEALVYIPPSGVSQSHQRLRLCSGAGYRLSCWSGDVLLFGLPECAMESLAGFCCFDLSMLRSFISSDPLMDNCLAVRCAWYACFRRLACSEKKS